MIVFFISGANCTCGMKRLSVKMISRHSKIVFREIAFEKELCNVRPRASGNFVNSLGTASQTTGVAHAQYQKRKQENKN